MQFRALAATLTIVLAIAGCAGGDEPTPEEAVADLCAALGDLEAAVQEAGAVIANPDATADELREARDEVSDQLDDVRDRAENVDEAQVDVLNDVYADLEQALHDVDGDTSIANVIQMIGPQVEAVNAAWDQLIGGLSCQ